MQDEPIMTIHFVIRNLVCGWLKSAFGFSGSGLDSLGTVTMVKGVSTRVKKASARMPFRPETSNRPPTTVKQQQRHKILSGLAAAKAPMVGDGKTNPG